MNDNDNKYLNNLYIENKKNDKKTVLCFKLK